MKIRWKLLGIACVNLVWIEPKRELEECFRHGISFLKLAPPEANGKMMNIPGWVVEGG